jgi:predicted nucleic acid-binding protein
VRIVADSNIYISGLLFTDAPARLLEHAIPGEIDVFISHEILEEHGGIPIVRVREFLRTQVTGRP